MSYGLEFYACVDQVSTSATNDVEIEFNAVNLAFQNRVPWTQFIRYQYSFKPWLTNNIVLIL